MKIKIYTIFAQESVDLMKSSRGKIVTQGQHAALHSYWDSLSRYPIHAKQYRDSVHAYKINLIVPTIDDLIKFHGNYKEVCGVSLVTDAGFTVFKTPTTTCLGIGPIPENLIGDDLSSLGLFK